MAVVQDRPGDFVLLSRDQSYLDMLDPRPDENFDILHYNIGSDMQHQFPDLSDNTYEPYPSTSPLSTNTSNCYNAQDSALVKPKDISGLGQRQMPTSTTTSPSVSRSFDHPPSTLSSASGASAQSTTSSAVGSPFSHATSNLPGQEHWVDSQQGLGIAAGIVHNESYGSEIYSLNHLEHDLVLSSDKFSNHFVGESQRFPSPSVSNSGSVWQSSILPSLAAPLTLDTNVVSREYSMDAIKNESTDRIGSPALSNSSAATSLSHISQPCQAGTQAPSPPQSNGSFKSPITPASAYSPRTPSTSSPLSARQHAFHSKSLVGGHDTRTLGIHRRALATSCRWSPYDQAATPSKSPGRSYRDLILSPFFGQSSGRFIAPLESSCWFSLIVFSFPHFSSSLISQRLLGATRTSANGKMNRSCSHTIFGYPGRP